MLLFLREQRVKHQYFFFMKDVVKYKNDCQYILASASIENE